MLFTDSKRSHHFKLLQSLMTPSFDSEPASFLRQYDAWKEQVVRHQQLSGDQIPDFIQLSAVVNGLKSDVSHYVRLCLASDSSFSDLDVLLRKYFNNAFVTTEVSLNAVWDKAWRDKQQGGKENGGKSKPITAGGSADGRDRKKSFTFFPLLLFCLVSTVSPFMSVFAVVNLYAHLQWFLRQIRRQITSRGICHRLAAAMRP